jgi:hypothetical protein
MTKLAQVNIGVVSYELFVFDSVQFLNKKVYQNKLKIDYLFLRNKTKILLHFISWIFLLQYLRNFYIVSVQ